MANFLHSVIFTCNTDPTRICLLSYIANSHMHPCALERMLTAAEGYGKAIKEVFFCWTSAINCNSLLGTVFLAHSVGSGSGLCPGATSYAQRERETGRVRGMGAVITSIHVATRITKNLAQVLKLSAPVRGKIW